VGRHRHVVNVRADGIAVVLGPLLSDVRITAAALVDVDSGMVLDAWSAAGPDADATATPDVRPPDLELLGAQHAEVVRCALALLRSWPSGDGHQPDNPEADTCEVVLGTDGGQQHLLRTVPDPHGDRLALSVVVDGPPRVLERVRRRLRSISVDALTAGPSMTRRPVLGGWSFATPGPDVPALPERPQPVAAPAAVAARGRDPAGTPLVQPPSSSGTDAAGLEVPVPRDGRAGSIPPVAAAAGLPGAVQLDAAPQRNPVADPTVPRLHPVPPVAPEFILRGSSVAPGRAQRHDAPSPRPPSPPAALPAPPPSPPAALPAPPPRETRRR